jgi:hypothetical protein
MTASLLLASQGKTSKKNERNVNYGCYWSN